MEIFAGYVNDTTGLPLAAALTDAPEIQIRREDTGAIVQAYTAMTHVGDGNYVFAFVIPDTSTDYSFVVDGDPNTNGNVAAFQAGKVGSFSGLADSNEAAIDTNLDAAVSSRAAPGDAMTLTAGERTAIDTELTSAHGAGSWTTGTGVADWTAGERENIRQALGVDGTKTAGGTPGDLQDVLADTAAMQPTVATNLDATVSSRSTLTQADILSDATPFPGGNIDAAITSRPTAAQIDTQLSGTHGPGSWEGATAPAVATAVWSELLPGAFGVGSAGNIVGNRVDVAISTRATPADITSAETNILNAIGALNDLSIADVQTALTNQGYTAARALLLDNLDGTISSVLAAIAALNDLSATDVENAVWDAARTAHVTAGSFGEALIVAAGHAGLHARLDGGAGFAQVQVNANNNLTSARLRIFATAAAEAAATNGAADGADGELKRLTIGGAYTAGNQTPSIEVLTDFSRTGA